MKKRKINTDRILAYTAIIIGLITVIIYIYQARIMAKQHQDSVWPYVFTGRSIDAERGLEIMIYNKGIGPAIIESVSLTYKNKTYTSWREILNILELKEVNYACSGIGILSPNDYQIIFSVQNPETYRKVWKKLYDVDIEIIYKSIHDEFWKVNSKGREKLNFFNNKDRKYLQCG